MTCPDKCGHCDGSGVECEVCLTCNEQLDNCNCEGTQPTEEIECSVCGGTGEIDEDEESTDAG